MHTRNRQMNCILLFSLSFILLFSICSKNTEEKMNASVIIYPQEGFHTDSFYASIEVKGNGTEEQREIYYTLDGSIPSLKSLKYDGAIRINAKDELNLITVRASVMQDGELTKPVTKTYFVGQEVEERFDIPVVSITVPEESLYDYEKGIFVTGKIYDEWLAEGGNPDPAKLWSAETNFSQRGDEWKREAYIEVYSKEGRNLVDMNGFISVAGNGSAPYPIKSINIESSDNIENGQKYFYNFVNEGSKFHSGGELTDSIRLRNSGNDFEASFIRQNVCNELAYESGIEAVSGITEVSVFLNGEYYCLLQAQNNFTKYNMAHMLEMEEGLIITLDAEKECEVFGECGTSTDFCKVDFNDEKIRKQFENIVNIDSLMRYYAIEMLIDNTDWPEKNYTVFRNRVLQDDGNIYKDGRYHFLFYDTDFCFERYVGHEDIFRLHFDENITEDEQIIDHPLLMKNMVKYLPYRDMFVNQVCDYLNTTFTVDNVKRVIDDNYFDISNELRYMEVCENELLRGYAKKIPVHIEELKYQAEKRLNFDVWNNLENYLGAQNQFNVIIKNASEGGSITCNSCEILDGVVWSGLYYSNIPVNIHAFAAEGYTFRQFVVNGEIVKSDTFVITEEMIEEGEVVIEVEFVN